MLHQHQSQRISRQGEAGLALVEIAVSLGIFAVLILSVLMTLTQGIVHRRESFESYLAMQALRSQIALAQRTANEPQDLTLQMGIGAVFDKYDNKTTTVPTLNSGQVLVTTYPTESTVPTLLGGAQDLNFDGDAADSLGNLSAGTDLKLVPMTFTATYVDKGNNTVTLSAHRLIGQTTD